MNHFEQILCQGESILNHNFHYNQQIYDKSTNQTNLISTVNDHIHSPFDSSPKASMFFFSVNSPRQNTDNFQFNNQNTACSKNSRDHIQPITRRLEFQEDASLFCQQQELEQEQLSVKQEEPWNFQSSETPQKGKKIKKSKNSKGLKNLSIGVYQIVAEKSQTTYKQVANALIQKLNRKAKEEMSTQAGYQLLKKVQKDQHNIKRRVYDALNVLISAELLRKQGKKVICNYNLQKQKGNKLYLQDQHKNLMHRLKIRQYNLEQKRIKYQQLQRKYYQLKTLMQKNKLLGPFYPNRINLPFIVVKSNPDDIKQVNIGKSDIEINYKKNVSLMGDVDTIQQIDFTVKSEAIYENNDFTQSERQKEQKQLISYEWIYIKINIATQGKMDPAIRIHQHLQQQNKESMSNK